MNCHQNVNTKGTNAKNGTMKVLLEIPDNKASSLMDVLKSISYVKAKAITEAKALLLEEIKEAVEEMKLIKAGKKKVRNAEDFLNEL
jgi:hypothetical protein